MGSSCLNWTLTISALHHEATADDRCQASAHAVACTEYSGRTSCWHPRSAVQQPIDVWPMMLRAGSGKSADSKCSNCGTMAPKKPTRVSVRSCHRLANGCCAAVPQQAVQCRAHSPASTTCAFNSNSNRQSMKSSDTLEAELPLFRILN